MSTSVEPDVRLSNMSLLEALSKLPGKCYAHPISSAPSSASKLNPYLPLPSAGNLLTNAAFLSTLPTPPAGTLINVLAADALTTLRSEKAVALISRTAQEAYDHSLLGLRLAQDEKAVVYHYISSEVEGAIEEVKDVQGWLDSALGSRLRRHRHGDRPGSAQDI
jgi:sulfite reductase (NADPH) hemoprotein beta-component